MKDDRTDRALRIERRNLRHFKTSAAAVLLVLHHEYFLINRQIAEEALEVLLKQHIVYLSCGPFVLKSLLERVEGQNGPGSQWLKWMKKIELDWVTFPNLRSYPPDREGGRDTWHWEHGAQEVDDGPIRDLPYNGHYDEYDHEGAHYDDNLYDPSGATLYPSFQPHPQPATTNANDPFGFANHYPFTDPSRSPVAESSNQEETSTKLELLVQKEVTPLFKYFASPTFSLTSITIPLYFVSKDVLHDRSSSHPGYTLPLKLRYWVHVCVHALLMLHSTNATLQEVRVKYIPWNIWATMSPADDLNRVIGRGVWFDEDGASEGRASEGEGEAFRAVWAGLREYGVLRGKERMGLDADVRLVPWDGDVNSGRVGDELEIVFKRKG
jgi:hypothetical protein